MLGDDYDPIKTEAPELPAQCGSLTPGGLAKVQQATEPGHPAAEAKSKCAAKGDGCRKITVSAKAHSRNRKTSRASEDRSEDGDGDGEHVTIGQGVQSKAQMSGRIRPRRKANWNDRSSLCGVFLNGSSERVHISADARAKGEEIWEKELAHLFEAAAVIDSTGTVTAATAGPDWSSAEIMTLDGPDSGRMRIAMVPPTASGAATGNAEE